MGWADSQSEEEEMWLCESEDWNLFQIMRHQQLESRHKQTTVS